MKELPQVVVPPIHIHVHCGGCQKHHCPEEYTGLVFSTGPDVEWKEPPYEGDTLYHTQWERNMANQEFSHKTKGASTMEKHMLTGQRTTARILSFRGEDGNPISLPTVYDINWSVSPGPVTFDVTSQGEIILTSGEEAGSVDVQATVSYVKNGQPKQVVDDFTLVVDPRETPPPPDSEPVGLLFEVDTPVDVAPPPPLEIEVKSRRTVRVNRKQR